MKLKRLDIQTPQEMTGSVKCVIEIMLKINIIFLLICDCFDDLRDNYLPKKYYTQPNLNKFIIIMSTTNDKIIKSVAVFFYYAYEKRKH